MWKYNYTISREALACHIIFTLGQSECVLASLSIHPSIHLSNIFSEWMRSFFTQKMGASVLGAAFDSEAVRPDVFKWLSGLVYGMYLFSDIQSKSSLHFSISASLGPGGNRMVVLVSCTRNWRGSGSGWLESKLTHVLHYGMDVRWQHCSAVLKPATVNFRSCVILISLLVTLLSVARVCQ